MYAKPPFCSFKICVAVDKEKAKKYLHFYFDLTELLFDVIINMLNMSMMIIVVL